MPLYEYQCDACGTRFERLQRIDDPAPETCERCGVPSPRRVVSSPAFQFKGSGWYATDYAKSGSGASKAGSDGPATSASASSAADSSGAADSSATPASPATSTPSTPSSGSDG